ncbi:MAG: HAD-IIIC family phosphatase [Patescibacteria group bacterium]
MNFIDIQKKVGLLFDNSETSVSEYLAVNSKVNELNKKDIPSYFRKIKSAFLGSFTLQGLPEIFRVEGVFHNLLSDNYLAPYNQFSQQILDNTSDLYKFNPSLVYLILDKKDIVDLGHINDLISKLKSRSSIKKVILFNFVEEVSNWNNSLSNMFESDNFVSIFDFNNFLKEIGHKEYWNTKYAELGDLRLSPQAFPKLAEKILSYAVAESGGTKKCLMTDLDGTLWNGVVGEDGVDNISLDLDLQDIILQLYKNGIVLTINSKNNFQDAMDVFEKHPKTVLNKNHFATWRINWQDKYVNAQEMAKELNLGVDSFAFIDDDPFQRNMIREFLPEVAVFHPNRLKDYIGFSSLVITEEDKKRSEMYVQERQRNELKTTLKGLDDFLKGLSLEVIVSDMNNANISRISQLTQKTNQFNLTTRRYSEEELRRFLDNGKILAISVKDRFGDYGLTGICMVKFKESEWFVDNFLLSCRILGRGVENTFLSYICNLAKTEGASKVIGEFIPTAKNKPSENFLKDFEFNCVSSDVARIIYEEKLDKEYSYSPFIKIKHE